MCSILDKDEGEWDQSKWIAPFAELQTPAHSLDGEMNGMSQRIGMVSRYIKEKKHEGTQLV